MSFLAKESKSEKMRGGGGGLGEASDFFTN